MKKSALAKIVSFISVLAMLAVMTLPVFAANSVKLAQSAEISDKTVVVKLNVPENSGLATFAATINYDSSQLEFASATYGAGNTNATNSKEDGKVSVNMVWTEAMVSAGNLFTVVFNVKPGAAGEVALPVSVDFATDKEDNDISVIPSTASVNIPKGLVPATTSASATEGSVKAKNPNTSGAAVKVGGAAIAVVGVAAIVGATVLIKKKKDS